VTRAALALLLGAAAGVLAATQPIADPDVFWHLATGRETFAHGIVRADVFSWTVRGASVSTDQWLGQVLMYGAFLLADWRGIAIMRVLCVVALVSLVGFNASQARPVRPLAIVLGTLPAFLLTRAVWVDRPELLGLVFFAALLLLLRWGRDGRPLALITVIPLIGFWANIHGSFALGVVLTVLVCMEGALRDSRGRRAYVACAAVSVVASFMTPAGLGTWTAPGFHLFSPPREIQEWGLVDVRTALGAAYVATLGLVIACVFLGPRLQARELIVLIPIAFLSLTALRQAPLLAIVAAPLFADRADQMVRWLLRRAGTTEGPRARGAPVAVERRGSARTAARLRGGTLPRSSSGFGRAGTLLAPATLLIVAVFAAPTALDERAYPVGALTSIPSGDGALARYEWGGWLIWRAPATPVFVDGRLTPYVGGVLDDYRRVVAAGPGWREVLARGLVRTLLVAPSDPVAVRARELGWRVIGASDTFILIAVP
jgi:hypothetical protein